MEISSEIKSELISTMNSFFNEIDLSFDYISKETIIKLTNFVKELTDNSEKFDLFVNETLDYLKPYQKDISFIVLSKTKMKRTAYEFMNHILLFDNILDFSQFTSENKNTKLTIVKYLYNIYMTSYLYHYGTDNNSTKEYIDYLNTLQKKILDNRMEKVKEIISDISNVSNVNGIKTNGIKTNGINPNGINPNTLNTGNLGNLFQSLMANDGIMSIASELSNDIKNENLDPLTLLSSMMSGKPNDTIQRLVSNISGKIERKIENGEIDKDLLEKQTESILKNVNGVIPNSM
jgi:hypothetical protein